MKTARDVYEKYRHLDQLLVDEEWLPDNFLATILKDCWDAVKYEAGEYPRPDGDGAL